MMLEFLYSGSCTLEDDDILVMLKLSYEWQLELLQNALLSHLESHLRHDNVINCYQIAFIHNYAELLIQTSRYIRRHFVDLISDLSRLTADSLELLLKFDEINIPSEDLIAQVVLDWMKKHGGTPDGEEKILNCIRYDRLSSGCLASLNGNPKFKTFPSVRGQMKLAQLYHRNPLDRHTELRTPRNWNTSARRAELSEDATDGVCSDGIPIDNGRLGIINNDNGIGTYDIEKKEFTPHITGLRWMNPTTMLSSDNGVLIIAGCDDPNEGKNIVEINISTKQVRHLEKLPAPMHSGSITHTNTVHIFITGGQIYKNGKWMTSDKIYQYSYEQKVWLRVATMVKPIERPIVQLHLGRLYVIGYTGSDRQSVVARYTIPNFSYPMGSPQIGVIGKLIDRVTCSCYISNGILTILTQSGMFQEKDDGEFDSVVTYSVVGHQIQVTQLDDCWYALIKGRHNRLSLYKFADNDWNVVDENMGDFNQCSFIFSLQ